MYSSPKHDQAVSALKTELLRRLEAAKRMKQNRERRQRLGEKLCRGGNGEGSPHPAVGSLFGRSALIRRSIESSAQPICEQPMRILGQVHVEGVDFLEPRVPQEEWASIRGHSVIGPESAGK